MYYESIATFLLRIFVGIATMALCVFGMVTLVQDYSESLQNTQGTAVELSGESAGTSAFCSTCGEKLENEPNFCPGCGVEVQ